MEDRAVWDHDKNVLEDLKEGDLIEFQSEQFSHWAVYIGEKRVIHLKGLENADDNSVPWITVNGERFKSVCVIQDYLWNVAKDAKACKNNDEDEQMTPYDPTEILRRAFDRIGAIYYNELSDCRDFAFYCRYSGSKLVQEIEKKNRTVLERLEKGDIVEFRRGMHTHWAIYVGHQNVVHFVHEENNNAVFDKRIEKGSVKQAAFWDIAYDFEVYKNDDKYKSSEAYTRQKTAEKAKEKIGEISYSNSEHFAISCIYNRSKQKDLNRIKPVLKSLVIGDIVEFRRETCSHWAVYYGRKDEKEMIVHLVGEDEVLEDDEIAGDKKLFKIFGKNFRKATAKLDDFFKVARDSVVIKNNKLDDMIMLKDEPETIKNRALDMIKTVNLDSQLKTCECFATVCRYGKDQYVKAIEEQQKENITVLEKLEEGDIVEFHRGLHTHWAIYVVHKNQRKVVHLVGEDEVVDDDEIARNKKLFRIFGKNFRKATANLDDFFEVARNSLAIKNNKLDDILWYDGSETIKNRALGMIGNLNFDIRLRTCECFAIVCRYGEDQFFKEHADQNKSILGCLVLGDLVEFRREYCSHWAVYYGYNEDKKKSVVHLVGEDEVVDDEIAGNKKLFKISGKNFRKATVKLEDFFKVARNSEAMKNNKLDEIMGKDEHCNIKNRLELVKKFESVDFNSGLKTCECFATFCRYGDKTYSEVTQNLRSNNESVLDSLEEGDLVKFCRGKYYHTAVYVGDGEVVYIAGQEYDSIHTSYDSQSKASRPRQTKEKVLVKKENIWQADHTCKISKISNDIYEESFGPEETKKRAISMLGEKDIDDNWSNSKRFAEFCRYGTVSDQIRMHNESVLKDLKEGRLIQLERERHWGVYVGNNIFVHLNDNNADNTVHRKGFILQNRIWDFAQNSRIIKDEEKDRKMTAYDPSETTSRANAEIGKPTSDRWKDCEDFATVIIYGTDDEQIFVHNRGVLRKLQEGDLIEIRRKLQYSHWAVYVGKKEVVHYASKDHYVDMNKAEIKCEGYWKVANGTKVLRNNFKDNIINPYEPEEIIKRARRAVGDIGYNVIWRNCEHFATECRYGKPTSDQVNSFKKWLVVAAFVALLSVVWFLANEYGKGADGIH